METKKWMFVDTLKKTNTLSSVTFEPEGMYKAYTRSAHGRKLYICLDEVAKRSPDLASELFNEALGLTNTEPT